MLIRIRLDGAPLIEVARICGCAPCQILAVNRVKKETELPNEILVPVLIEHLVKRPQV